MTEPLAIEWHAETGTAFAALTGIPVEPRAWRYDRALPWQAPEPHLWTPGGATIPVGRVVWCVCARTRSGNRALRVYPLAARRSVVRVELPATRADLLAAGLATGVALPFACVRVTRRQVLAGGAALAAVAGVAEAEQPYPAPKLLTRPRFRLVALHGAREPLLAIPHAGIAVTAPAAP